VKLLYQAVLAVSLLVIQVDLAAAKEIPISDPKQLRGPPDWLKTHRLQYLDISSRLPAEKMDELLGRREKMVAKLDRREQPAWSFIEAAKYNTLKVAAQEYQTISQRLAYYDLLSYLLEWDKNTPESLGKIKFFHATTVVTSKFQIGAAEILDRIDELSPVDLPVGKRGLLSPTTRELLKQINQTLFEKNMVVLRKLFYEWKEPRDPRLSRSTARIGEWEFDLSMVEFEQDNVEL
jgi:hypothetical protein